MRMHARRREDESEKAWVSEERDDVTTRAEENKEGVQRRRV